MMHMVIEKQLTAAFHAALSPVEQQHIRTKFLPYWKCKRVGGALCMYMYIQF